ncbi:response regulator [Paenibacillus sp. CC-CFT747]|nr:response regulator [Paenibacillus sp. CC-CFT747]
MKSIMQESLSTVAAEKKVLRILIGEEHEINQQVVSKIVQSLGCISEIAFSAAELVETCSKEPFDYVLLDLELLSRNSLTVAEIVQAARLGNPSVSLVVLTSDPGYADKQKCLSAGAVDYVEKPLRRDRIQKILTSKV